jgi:plasmid maintenance system antidote protein VapI
VAYRTDSEIGARIGQLLEETGRSQAEVAAAIQMDPTALNKVISGRRGLSGTELVLLARELGTAPQALIVEDEQPVFALRASSDASIETVMRECEQLIDGYLRLEALVPNP